MLPKDSESCTSDCRLRRSQFVLRYGVLGWGVPTGILFALLQSYAHGWDGFWFHLIPALILFPVGGYFWGRIMWKLLERKRGQMATPSGNQ